MNKCVVILLPQSMGVPGNVEIVWFVNTCPPVIICQTSLKGGKWTGDWGRHIRVDVYLYHLWPPVTPRTSDVSTQVFSDLTPLIFPRWVFLSSSGHWWCCFMFGAGNPLRRTPRTTQPLFLERGTYWVFTTTFRIGNFRMSKYKSRVVMVSDRYIETRLII